MKNAFFIFFACVLVCLLFGSCNKNGAVPGNSTDFVSDELRLPLDTAVPTLDPAHMTDVTSFAVATQLFGRLVRFDENVKLQPEMAENYSTSPDGCVVTFKLKKGILFHDHPAFGGKRRECTSDDFVYSFTRLLDPKTASERGSLLFVVKGARAYYFSRMFPITCDYLAKGNFTDENEPANTLERIKDSLEYELELRKPVDESGSTSGINDDPVFPDSVDIEPIIAAIDANLKERSDSIDQIVLEYLLNLREELLPIDSVSGLSAPDPYTFEITLAKPYRPFVSQMAMINFAPVPREVIESYEDKDTFSRQPIGTGAFRLKEWKVDRYLLLEAFPQKNKPELRIKTIRYLVEPDRQTQFQKYLNNELDISNVPTGQYSKIKNDASLSKELHREDQLAIQFFVLNLTKDPWRNELFQEKKALRQAVNYAINREYICEEILEGRFRPFVGLIPPSLKEWTNPETAKRPRYTYDTEKARKMLEQAGHPQGLFLEQVRLSSDRKGDYPAILTEVQGDLRNISIKTDLNFLEWAAYIDAMQNNRLSFFRLGWSYDFPDPDSLIYTLLHSSQRGASGNFAWYRNPEVDRLIDEARTSLDQNKRKQLYWRIEEIVLEDAPWIFAFVQTSNVLIKPRVRGIKLSGMDTDASLPNADLSKVWIDHGVKNSSDSAKTGSTNNPANEQAMPVDTE